MIKGDRIKNYYRFIYLFGLILVIITTIIFLYINYRSVWPKTNKNNVLSSIDDQILPSNGVMIPVKLGNLGEKMVQASVIDKDKIEDLYVNRGQKEEIDRLLSQNITNTVITKENAGLYLNFFWALGLGNKNMILENGPMVKNGDTSKFASTGGWTLSKGNVMDHYSKYELINLSSNQQKMVVEISKNIYRPCCDNSTYFPDCNHGMAMLGFLELMASQGFSEKEIYKNALILNSFWFPNDYSVIAQYLLENNKSWVKTEPKIILGKDYSSSQGLANIRSKVKNPPKVIEGSGCKV